MHLLEKNKIKMSPLRLLQLNSIYAFFVCLLLFLSVNLWSHSPNRITWTLDYKLRDKIKLSEWTHAPISHLGPPPPPPPLRMSDLVVICGSDTWRCVQHHRHHSVIIYIFQIEKMTDYHVTFIAIHNYWSNLFGLELVLVDMNRERRLSRYINT